MLCVSIGECLKALDERVFPNPWAGKFDTRVPAWMAYGPFLGPPAGFGLYYAVKHLHGLPEALMVIGIVWILGVFSMVEWRWRRKHRLTFSRPQVRD